MHLPCFDPYSKLIYLYFILSLFYFKEIKWFLSILIDMAIQFYHIILAVKILGWFLLKWVGFGELLGWKSSTRSGNTGPITKKDL